MQPNNNLTVEQGASLLTYYRANPDMYVKQVLGADLWQTQIDIVTAIFRYSNVAVKTCNSIGKSFVAARIAVTYLTLFPNSIVVTTAPTWNQVVNVLWREIATTVKQAKYKLTDKQVTQAGLTLDTKWYAIGVSTSTPDNMMGFHADNLLVIVDEAGGVEDIMFNGVKAITTNVNNKVLLIGNPTNPGGVFWNAFEPGSPYKQFTVSAFDTPNMKANRIDTIDELLRIFTPPEGADPLEHYEETKRKMILPFPELIHPGTVYQRYREWGIDSSAWQSLIMGEFPNQSDNALFPVDLVKQAMNNHGVDDETGKTFAELSGWNIPDGPQEYGLDVARFGSDKTILTPRRGGWVDKPHVWEKQDLITSADRVLTVIDPYKPHNIKIDDTGVGGGVSDALHRYATQRTLADQAPYQYNLSRYVMSMAPKDKDKFHDITSEIYYNLAMWFRNKQIAIPYDKELFDELVGRRWKILPSGKIKVESKEDYRTRTKSRSPDKSDSLALAFADSLSLNTLQQTDVDTMVARAKIQANPIDNEEDPYRRKRNDLTPVTGGLMDRY
jgi:phage terminase large subunit